MNTHTPGPWDSAILVSQESGDLPIGTMVVVTPNDLIVCSVAPPGKDTREDAANARLIAAAPELLSLAEAVRDTFVAGTATSADVEKLYQTSIDLIEKAVQA